MYCTALFWAMPSSAPAAGPPPLRLGIILPLTGQSADIGKSALVGAQVAVDEINSVGGYLGRPLELVVHDDQSDPDKGMKAAHEVVEKDQVMATIGFCNAAVALPAVDYFQSIKHPLIVSCSTASTITSKYPPAQSYVYRVSASSSVQAQFLVEELMKSKLSKVALLVDTSPYGDAGLADLQAAMGKVNLRPKAVVRFALGSKSLEKEMRELKSTGADVLIGWTVGREQGLIAAARAAVGWTVPQYGGWDLSNSFAYESSGGKLEGAFMAQTVLPNRQLERNSSFLSAYLKRSNERPIGSLMSAAQTYDAVQMLMRAVFVSKGDLSGPSLKYALEHSKGVYRGVITTYDKPFSAQDHESITANMLWLGTWRNGDRAYAYAEDEKRAAVIRRKK
jgi:branched-chain amino acid transport system substrate-binding protein